MSVLPIHAETTQEICSQVSSAQFGQVGKLEAQHNENQFK